MKASIIKVSTSKLKVMILSIDNDISYDTISLSQIIDKNNTIPAISLPYEKGKIEYIFDLSETLPRETGWFDYVVSLDSEGSSESTRKTKIKFSTSWHIAGMARKIKHDLYIASKRLNGSKVFLFKKMSSGEKCPECWNEDMQSSDDSNCKTCGGSGKITTYSKPVKTYAGPLIYSDVTYDTGIAGKELLDRRAAVTVDADLMLTSDDIMFYVQTGDFLRVDSSSPSLLQSEPVTQKLVVQELPSGSFQAEIPEGEL